MPTIFLFATICRATVAETCGLSWLSPRRARLSFTRWRLFGTPGIALPAFQFLIISLTQLLWSLPRNAAPPVSGPAKPRLALLHSGFTGFNFIVPEASAAEQYHLLAETVVPALRDIL